MFCVVSFSVTFVWYSDSFVPKEEALHIFEKADTLLEGNPEDHNSAFQLLSTYENEVCKTNVII